MNDVMLSVLCLVATLGLYYANKRLYRRFHKLPLMPLVFTPILLVLILVLGHISYQSYMGETHWLLWLLGPATIAFAVPVYENVAVIKRHWMSLSAGVVTAVVVALFVVITGVFGMAVGDMLFLRLAIREGMAKGAGFGAASHGAGTARSYELGQQEGVVASLVMMLSGVVVVLAAPLVRWLLF